MNRTERRQMQRAQRGHSKPPVNRKIWRTDINTIEHAKSGAAITPEHERDHLWLREHSSLDAFVHGYARMAEWSDLVNMNNIAMTMADMGIKKNTALPACQAAEKALIETAERYQRTGKMGLSGAALEAIRAVLKMHEEQRASISKKRYEEAIRLTAARIKSGYATIDLAKTLAA
jgi:hypothetical protein